MHKRFLSTILLVAVMLVARPAFAETNQDSLYALIQSLMAQVQELQSQLVTLQGEVGDDSTVSTGLFRLLTPNGGDQWQMQSQHAITWQPDPHSTSTVGYLEKKTSSGFQTIGKIIPVGKGSIIWDGEVGASGRYPRPGDYYVRLENLITGKSDRSDRAFTLLKPGALVGAKIQKINGEEPDEELYGGRAITISASDKDAKITWTSKRGVDSCLIVIWRSGTGSDTTVVENLPPSGTEIVPLPERGDADYYTAKVVCSADDGSGTGYDNIGDDFVYLIIGDGDDDGAYSIDFTTPDNTGETYGMGEVIPVKFAVYTPNDEPSIAIRIYKRMGDKELLMNEVFYPFKDGYISEGKDSIDFYPAKGSSYPLSAFVGEFRLEIVVGEIMCCKYWIEEEDSDMTGWFTISSGPTTTPSIQVVSPNGGEKLIGGNKYTITWKSSNLPTDTVGISVVSEYGNLTTVVWGAKNTGSYTWLVPESLISEKPRYKMLISSTDKGPTVEDYSDDWFEIARGVVTYPPIYIDPYETSKVLGASASYQDVLNQMANTLKGMQELLQGLQ